MLEILFWTGYYLIGLAVIAVLVWPNRGNVEDRGE